MPKYNVIVPFIVEYLSCYDSPTFSSGHAVVLENSIGLRIGALRIEVAQEEARVVARVVNVEAKSQGDAVELARTALELTSAALSLELQTQNPNQHYGHPRFVWRARDIEVREVAPSTSITIGAALAINTTQHLTATRVTAFVSAMATRPDLTFLVRSYYEALAPFDLRSKFYNAFVVIEYVEQTLTPATTPMLSASQVSDIRKAVEAAGVSKDRVASIAADLAKRTNESRRDKLLEILRTDLQITGVEYAGQVSEINSELVQQLLKARNGLFHAKAELPEGFKRLTDTLILLVEKIVLKLLERHAVSPQPLIA